MISAKINLHSINSRGQELVTLEVIMPRYILAEFNTHRIKGKNSASSRAIPFNKMVKEVQERPFIPYAWQKDHKGMQGIEYFTEIEDIKSAEGEWLKARDLAVQQAIYLNQIGVTKQLVNRLLEPFMYHKVLVSATEWENFFNLRCPSYTFHNDDSVKDFVYKSRKEAIKDLGVDNPVEYPKLNVALGNLSTVQWLELNTGQADIHMMFLAEAIYDAIQESTPTKLKDGQWHIPFSNDMDEKKLSKIWFLDNNSTIEYEDKAILELKCKISIARCARLSYQTLGDNPVIDYEKDLALYKSLSTNGHASPTEHIARAMTKEEYDTYIKQEGDNIQKGWCRNYRGFRQWREIKNL